MSIAHYIKVIGRGKDGARPLDRTQAQDLLTQVFSGSGSVSDLEIGAFCLAMRIKGETAEEMAGFLDAIQAHLPALPAASVPTVVLPSYNGARKLPVLTPLLALLLARQGLRVLIHGQELDPGRITTHQVLNLLQAQGQHPIHPAEYPTDLSTQAGVTFIPTAQLCPPLQKLLDVRRVIGVRNSAHSLVKLLNPVAGNSLLVSSYTHPEYLHSMGAVFRLLGNRAMLLRGTEGEAVADARRIPQMDVFDNGTQRTVQEAQSGTLLGQLPQLPPGDDAAATAQFITQVLAGMCPIPVSIGLQVEHIVAALHAHV